ncbi:DUF1294 domain-containing protein [Lederbergia citrea]|uniref:DUF1294 domain-containing protein n=1 Tax=Lederbergia citrea TaxID=2833581 RepID=A0A942Z2M5_9BACI|nr:DUF1294 domain-containing protein [Lederbergia citrea]MBS4202645.1 DUF1294 domain-containing protein [Lederbergia citrea]MBS4222688.1 DUF1294 domain-containing protein [Lederbergia citrea]
MTRFLVIWYCITINVLGLLMMRNDKRYAQKRKRRISERNLWLAAFAGGAPGMTVGMRMYRHKTKHFSFKYGFPVLAVIDIVIYFLLLGRVS